MKDINNTNQENRKEVDKDIYSSLCSGLAGQKARRKLDNKIVCADNVTKSDGPFYCPVCLSDAIIRKCTEKVDHFAHSARQSPIIGKKDKLLHAQCQNEILAYLQKKFPSGKWEKERPIPKTKDLKEIIPDISGRIDDLPIAIEVQISPYTINRIYDKLIEYQKRNIVVLYIIPLYKELGEEVFRPRLFEKYLHSLYFGRIYYWIPNNDNKIVSVHLGRCTRWIEELVWLNEQREECSAGGYFLTYKTVRKPFFGESLDIAEDFKRIERGEFNPKNDRKKIPACTLFIDKHKRWWPNNEHVIQKESIVKTSELIEEYDPIDEYDEYLDDFEKSR